MPEISPGLFGNQSHPCYIGTIYVKPLQTPNPTEKVNMKAKKLSITTDIAIIDKPIEAPIAISLHNKIQSQTRSIKLDKF